MANIGYARVSTADQDCTIQVAALRAAGCETIRSETRSGTSLKGRSELEAILTFIRKGDTLVVTRIDRLARSLNDLLGVANRLQEQGADLRALEQPVDTSTASGRAFFGMLGVFAQFETELRKERQLEGIAKAKAAGAYRGRGGRPKSVSVEEILREIEAGTPPLEVARKLKVGKSSVYRAIASAGSG